MRGTPTAVTVHEARLCFVLCKHLAWQTASSAAPGVPKQARDSSS